jgi:hypothetical protein
MKTPSIPSRYRLLTSLLALALALIALAAAPAPTLANAPGWSCETGCWSWDAQRGCTQEVVCCAHTDGRWFCLE